MAQDLTVNIKTTSDVPEAMNKAKTAVSGFDKQLQDIRNKFGTSFKDIFLAALGPMALVASATALIGKIIADNQRRQEEATQAAIEGTNKLMSAEDRYYANKRNNEKKAKDEAAQATLTREQVTLDFLKTDPRGQQIVKENRFGPFDPRRGVVPEAGSLSERKDIQDLVQAMISADMKANAALNVQTEPETQAEQKAGSFKGPEGFGTVIGVGANPVMEKMTRQNEILEEIKIILQEQSLINRGQMVPSPFTEAVPITMQKIGAV
jgi:hypothetical protein